MHRILLIDDDDAVRGLLREELEEDYEVIDTGSPNGALVMALQQKPDAILLDLSMAGFSGFELCQAISSLSATQAIPIFIVSGHDARNRAFCQGLGASGFFQKPIDFVKLKTELASTLHFKESERRSAPRPQLRMNLMLKGHDKDGNPFNLRATSENMSDGGFRCCCAAGLDPRASVEVFLVSEGEYPLGTARAVQTERVEGAAEGFESLYSFQFIKG